MVLKAFAAVIRLKLWWLLTDLTAIKASPPAIRPAAVLFIRV